MPLLVAGLSVVGISSSVKGTFNLISTCISLAGSCDGPGVDADRGVYGAFDVVGTERWEALLLCSVADVCTKDGGWGMVTTDDRLFLLLVDIISILCNKMQYKYTQYIIAVYIV